MHHSDAEVSLVARCLLRGAPALTATGLPPASSVQREPRHISVVDSSGRTMAPIVSGFVVILGVINCDRLPRR